MYFLLALLLLAVPVPGLAQNFGNIPPQTVIGNPSPTATQPAQPMPAIGVSVTAFGAVPDNPAIDNRTAINAALSGSKIPVIIDRGRVFYTSGPVAVPDGATLVLNGTLRRISSYTATDGRALVVQSSTVGSSIIGSGTIDLNSPASGNWLSGLAPNGNTANVVNRDFTITGATFGGLDWNFAAQYLIHTNDAFDNIKIVNSGARGAYFAGMRGGHATNINVISTGDDAISVTGNQNWALVTPYVSKANPPPVIYPGLLRDRFQVDHGRTKTPGSETGMCIFLAPTNDRVAITSPICDGNLNAQSDGIGIGENTVTSTTSFVVGAGSKVFTIPAGSIFAPGFKVTIVSSATPAADQMYGTVTDYSGGTALTVNVTSFKGAGPWANWIINTEPGPVTITNPIVNNAGLFGIDCASNMTVTGGIVSNSAERGINIGGDRGGRVSNCHISGTTVHNTGPSGSAVSAGVFWGSTLSLPGHTLFMDTISLTGVNVTDDRTNPGTLFGQNVNVSSDIQYKDISYDGLSVAAPPFGYSKSYNVFGAGLDPHLDGSCFPFTPALIWTGGPPTGSTVSGCYRQFGKTMTVQMMLNSGTALNGATGVKVGLPSGAVLAYAGAVACSSPGGAGCGAWANNGDTSFTMFAPAPGGLTANTYYTLSGSINTQ